MSPVIRDDMSDRSELWVTWGRIKMQGKEGGDLGCSTYVGLDNSFLLLLAGRESCPCSPAHRGVICPHPAGKPRYNQINMKLQHISSLCVNGFRQARASAPLLIVAQRW